eukprot:2682427-Rhodomonas_salina.1
MPHSPSTSYARWNYAPPTLLCPMALRTVRAYTSPRSHPHPRSPDLLRQALCTKALCTKALRIPYAPTLYGPVP